MIRRAICLGMATLIASAVTVVTHAEKSEVPDDALSVKIGQTVYVAFLADGDKLVSPHVLPKATTTEPMVTIQLTQDGPTRTLLVTNGFAKTLVYRAFGRARGRRREIEIQVVPVRGGLQSIVTLAEPYEAMLLFGFHLTDSE